MACAGPLLPTSKHDRDEGQRNGERGQEEMLEDEFACGGALRGALMMLHPSVERIFGVNFRVGTGEDDDLPHSDGQIWLKLNGRTSNVSAAKLFVKGVVNQEEQQEVSYPGVLHCVFSGARGLFMDCLIKNTSAHIVVGSPGCLLISGLTEPVVKAFSLITDLVNRYQSAQGPCTVSGDWGPGEFLDSRRAFKHLVERWDDGHTLDLLVLPGTVKESLLDLVKESGLRSNPGLVVSAGERELGRIPQTLESSRRPSITDGRELNGEVGELREMARGLQHNRTTDYSQEDSIHNRDPHARLRSPGGSSLESPFWTAHGREQQRDGMRKGLTTDPRFHSFPERENNPRQAEQAPRTAIQGQSPQEVGEEGELGEGKEDEEHGELLLSVGSKKEFGLLLKFFTAMGYTEDVVMSVLARTGPKEASQILDLVQQEQDRSDRRRSRNRPSETEHVEEKREKTMGAERSDTAARERNTDSEGKGPGTRAGDEGARRDPDFGEVAEVGRDRGGGRGEEEEEEKEDGGNREDFVLGVLKRAAASCGYTEQKVEEVYGMLPGHSTHQLLLELQREGAREAQRLSAVGGTRREEEEPREVDEAASEAQRELNRGGTTEAEVVEKSGARAEREEERRSRKERKTMEGGRGDHPKQTVALPEPIEWNARNRRSAPQSALLPAAKLETRAPQVKGPPQHTYPSALDPQANHSASKTPQPRYPQPSHPTPPLQIVNPQRYQLPKPALQPTYLAPPGPFHNPSKFFQPPKPDPQPMSPTQPSPFDLPASRERDKWGLQAVPSGAVVTGEQRFLESLQTPFDLKLTNDPGDSGLRGIIIDGSNVAMSHGLGHFFSCRGIALAVQHFWNRGHRHIVTFLPQWRQKRDYRGKEQHFLTELQNLGLISYTPSREVEGKRINSYDDRFMLQLAQKTDGVIVTNDNLRDLLDESPVFRDIIKKRLLQYTFVGDHFMVPDDPLGRGGPHLDDFLRSQNRTLIPGNHSFAGLASSFPSSRTVRSQTEVLQFRDRTLGAPAEPEFGQQGRQRGRGQGKAGPHSAGQRQRAGLDVALQRSEADTAILRESLCQVFPGQDSMVALVLQSNPIEKDMNILSDFILEQQGESLMEH